jgi:ectoine hydroxylase-related dioxygenase (phytanoyl-CoA dioxygenase family)
MNSEVRIQNLETNGFSRFLQNGFQILASLISAGDCHRIADELTPLFAEQIKKSKSRIGGVRNLLRTNSLVASFARNNQVIKLVAEAGGKPVFPVRAIFFDKNPDSNWMVPWHQDLAIAVDEQIETPGYSGWSTKDGAIYVHPPAAVLESMITLRLHLDACDAGNGALKVIAGSHSAGKIPSAEVAGWVAKHPAEICVVPSGGALLMRPLLLHASMSADNPQHRRVLHIEYASHELPNGLRWLDN